MLEMGKEQWNLPPFSMDLQESLRTQKKRTKQTILNRILNEYWSHSRKACQHFSKENWSPIKWRKKSHEPVFPELWCWWTSLSLPRNLKVRHIWLLEWEPWRRLVQKSGKVIASVLLLHSEFTGKHLLTMWGLLLVSTAGSQGKELTCSRE